MVSMAQKVVARLFKIGRQAGAIAKWGIVVVSAEPQFEYTVTPCNFTKTALNYINKGLFYSPRVEL